MPDDFNEPLEDFGEYGEEPKVESILGILKQYANPALVEQEKDAWERAAAEKYLEKMEEMGIPVPAILSPLVPQPLKSHGFS